jgi:hypothetical protein
MKFPIDNCIPGSELLNKGFSDLENNFISEESLLVLIASKNLKDLGFIFDKNLPVFEKSYEHLLYEQLYEKYEDGAHSKYNSLIRRLVSAEQILRRQK